MSVLRDEEGEALETQTKRELRLNTGTQGMHSVIPFQCEVCWMRNLERRDPDSTCAKDSRYVQCLRRANLDAMSGKAKSTVRAHVGRIEETIRNGKSINRSPRFEPRGPFPLDDIVGMGLAVDMLMKSLTSKGRVSKYIQFDTMRETRSTYTKVWASSVKGISEGASFAGNASKIRFTSCPSQSEWFGDFLTGAEDRMGYETKKQKYLPISVIIEQLRLIEQDALLADPHEARTLYKLGALICVLTAGSLRGHEGFYFDLGATRAHIDKGRQGVVPAGVLKRSLLTEEECAHLPEVCICLVGKFKGETGERYHSLVLASESSSGLKTRWWVEKLISVCQSEGRTSGFAFGSSDGSHPSGAEYNALVRQYLGRIQESRPDLFSPEEDLSRYGISRTYRKSAESRARRAGMKEEEVKVMNRWQSTEQAKGKRPRRAMIDHYSDARALVSITWKYSYAL